MRSLLGTFADKAVTRIPFAPSRATVMAGMGSPLQNEAVAQMSSLGAVGTLFAIVDSYAQSVSESTWHLYRKSRSGKPEDRVEVTKHPALDLWNNPNPFWSLAELLEASEQYFDLVGEIPWLIVYDSVSGKIPLEIWPVRPDRIKPIPHPEEYLTGWIYSAPDGEKIPLKLNELILTRRPNPLDPYRGIGAVQSILADIDSARFSAEWNRNFFLNSAEPGGIIEVDRRLGDDEFEEMVMRWNMQHKGIARAHRVAILEQGKWIERKFTNRDMQFADLRNLPRDIIREAFRFPTHMLGESKSSNRAVAEAQEYGYGKHHIQPRLARFRSALNTKILPLFPGSGDLEFDFDSVVPDDQSGEAATNASKAAAAKTMIDAGFEATDVLSWLGMPDMERKEPEPPPAPIIAPPMPPQPAPDETSPTPDDQPEPSALWRPLARLLVSRPEMDANPKDLPDLSHVQTSWQAALLALLQDWADVTSAQKDDLVRLVHSAISSGQLDNLIDMVPNASVGTDVLKAAMVELAAVAGREVVAEADDQGVSISASIPSSAWLEAQAAACATFLARELAISAGREALRVTGQRSHADDVADIVRAHLDSLTTARAELYLGGSLTQAQHAGRLATLQTAPEAAYYSSEMNDTNTCGPCAQVNGKWLGNSLTGDVALTYPSGGYIECLGRQRCRGMVTALWRPRQVNT